MQILIKQSNGHHLLCSASLVEPLLASLFTDANFLTGQMCIAGSRILVQEGIYDEFVDKLAKSAKSFAATKGDPFDLATQHMPQVSEVQLKVNVLIVTGIHFMPDNVTF